MWFVCDSTAFLLLNTDTVSDRHINRQLSEIHTVKQSPIFRIQQSGSSAILTTGQMGHWPRALSCTRPHYATGIFLLFDF